MFANYLLPNIPASEYITYSNEYNRVFQQKSFQQRIFRNSEFSVCTAHHSKAITKKLAGQFALPSHF